MKVHLKGIYVYADNQKVGRMDYDHKILYIFEWYDWIDQGKLINALMENDIDEYHIDASDAERYWNDVKVIVEDL